jgi:hypothetical protein
MMSTEWQATRERPVLSARLRRWALGLLALGLTGTLAGTGFTQGPAPRAPVKVTVRDDKPVLNEEAAAPLDPQQRIQFQPSQLGVAVRTVRNETLHLSHFPSFLIDGQFHQQQPPGQWEYLNRPLPRGQGRKDRVGFQSALKFNDLRIVCTVTLAPTKPATKGAKRQLNSVLVHYLVENKGNRPHKVGVRIYMDVYVINNDGAQFAAPTMPGKILNGVELKDKLLPPYVQLLQVPNLKNPGYVAHLTLDLGSKLEKPNRVVLTQHGQGFGNWNMQAVFAGDTALGVFWEPKEIKPGGKREVAYGYGQGIVTSPESDGAVQLALGGSFEPGKAFDVTAYVTDPAAGQSLALELPPGMELVQGPQLQPVPEPPGDEATSVVRWRARVLRPGEFPLRVRSSTGVTQGKTITVTPAGG